MQIPGDLGIASDLSGQSLSAYAAEGVEIVREITNRHSLLIPLPEPFWLLRAEYPVQIVDSHHTELPRLDICCGPR